MTIEELRNKIDYIDEQLLELFNCRAALALKIGEVKKCSGLPVYDPGREQQIFLRMKERNCGPLDNLAIVRLFERVIDESRSLERLMTSKESAPQPALPKEDDQC